MPRTYRRCCRRDTERSSPKHARMNIQTKVRHTIQHAMRNTDMALRV